MASRSESVFSYTDDDKPNYDILSRQNLPANSFGRLVLDKPPFPYRLMGTLSSIDVHKKQFGVLVKLEKSDPEELIRSLHDYYTKNDPEEEDEVESEVEEESKNEEKSVGEESKNEEKSVGEEESQGEEESGGEGKPEDEEKLKEEKKMGAEKVAERQYISKRCKDVMRSEIAIGNIYAAYIDELKKVVRVRVLQINRINMTSATAPLQLEVHVLDYGMITTISEGKLMMLHNFFAEGEYGTALALTCCLPDERLFDGAPFPRLENFKLGNKVEVYVLSDEEPCLAVLGSLGTSPNSLPNAIFSYGVDARHADSFNRVVNGFMSAEPEMHKGWTSNGLIRSVCWSLVTIASCEDLANIAVRDVFTSLRYLHLQYSINRAYKKEGFHQTMAIDPAKLYSGAPVIVFYNPLGSFIRGTVTRVNGDGCDVEALDIPDLNVCNVPLNHLFYPSSVLLNIPPQIFYVNLTKGVTPTDECCDVVQELLGDNSVAALKFSLDHECVQLVNGNNININDVIEGYLEEADNEGIDDGDVDGKGGKTPDGEAPGGEGEAPDGEAQGEDQAVDDQGEDGSVSGLNTPDSDDVGLSF